MGKGIETPWLGALSTTNTVILVIKIVNPNSDQYTGRKLLLTLAINDNNPARLADNPISDI